LPAYIGILDNQYTTNDRFDAYALTPSPWVATAPTELKQPRRSAASSKSWVTSTNAPSPLKTSITAPGNGSEPLQPSAAPPRLLKLLRSNASTWNKHVAALYW